ncbi:hypothetical protein DPMN_130911 [Dreissena polymorpha]|uniref:Uncharacterized protein n=1 Tax=Dreissena polymorpha TaxID=45954 RepID=A0A9D4H8I1_DREPO|nr:hypothetical protein DPMN_130911 [Dreissena polymorpha]
MFSTEKQTSHHPVQSFCFEFMADEATGAATKEQMALAFDFTMQRKHVSGRSSFGLPSASLLPTKLWLFCTTMLSETSLECTYGFVEIKKNTGEHVPRHPLACRLRALKISPATPLSVICR